jgi:EAL domain-containing protein (putative c-di-GMP-specific phosphodiesterase class I)
MQSCTIAHATPRVHLRLPAPGASGGRHASGFDRLGTLRAGLHARCSAAGLARRAWLARLKRALSEQRFVVHYQPIVSLRDGSVRHHEALVRLADGPQGTLVAPGAFLPAAERYGLVCEIDRLVLDRVLAVLARDGGGEDGPCIAVNLSALSLTDEDMLDYIERGLAGHGVSAARLVVEITETASISDMRQARAFCTAVQELGCAVALDDFGAGFGTLHYLKQLPFSYLKIDGGFIAGLPRSPHDQLVVRALVDLARGMGSYTIAEFVGDEPTLELLAGLGVDYAQGFHVGRPTAIAPILPDRRAAAT